MFILKGWNHCDDKKIIYCCIIYNTYGLLIQYVIIFIIRYDNCVRYLLVFIDIPGEKISKF